MQWPVGTCRDAGAAAAAYSWLDRIRLASHPQVPRPRGHKAGGAHRPQEAHLLLPPPYLPFPVQQQLPPLDFHRPASPQAAYAQLQKDLVQHFDCFHTGCLGFLGEVFGLGEEAQDMVRSSVRLTRGMPRAHQGP